MKLNFEKVALFVFILIILLSSVNIYKKFLPEEDTLPVSGDVETIGKSVGFQTILTQPNNLFAAGKYKDASIAYISSIYSNSLTPEQKSFANFNLGLCYYNMKQYAKATDSFLASTEFNSDDAVAYNNAAVSTFMANDMTNAVKYQNEALKSLPIVEFYYNLGRMYETLGEYEEAVRNYSAVIKGEKNISSDNKIDPIRIKYKITQLVSDRKVQDQLSTDIVIALKIKENREVLLINDSNMEIKSTDFTWKIKMLNNVDKLYCNYDKKKNDPYNLIKSLTWTIKTDEKIVFTGKESSLTFKINPSKKYIITLRISDGVKIMNVSRTIKNRKSEVNSEPAQSIVERKDQVCKIYYYAIYEQVFDKPFKLTTKGYTDRFGVLWGKDDIETNIMYKDFTDDGSSLYINNNSGGESGIWASLDTLLKDKNLQGKQISINFYARKITDNPQLKMKTKVRVDNYYVSDTNEFSLDYKWRQLSVPIYIPEDADGFTVSFDILKDEQIKLDGFFIKIM